MSLGRPVFHLRGRSSAPLAPVVSKRLGAPFPADRVASLWEIADSLHRMLWDDLRRKGEVEILSRSEGDSYTIVWQVVECPESEAEAQSSEKSVATDDVTDDEVSRSLDSNKEHGVATSSGGHHLPTSELTEPKHPRITEPSIEQMLDVKYPLADHAIPSLPIPSTVSIPSGVQPWEYEAVKGFLERRAQNQRLESTATQGLEGLGECSKSLGWELTAYRCERAINELCVRIDASPLFTPRAKKLVGEYPSEGFAGVVEEGTLGPVEKQSNGSPQETLAKLRAELNQKREKKVQTVPELQTLQAINAAVESAV
ncbi:hypothetical protein C8Q74DRAFT_1216757 [Fomes fomentarius]|nr:hypothetical protein C8Q74DRAFT_1216757 [Fomes fomentarius]